MRLHALEAQPKGDNFATVHNCCTDLPLCISCLLLEDLFSAQNTLPKIICVVFLSRCVYFARFVHSSDETVSHITIWPSIKNRFELCNVLSVYKSTWFACEIKKIGISLCDNGIAKHTPAIVPIDEILFCIIFDLRYNVNVYFTCSTNSQIPE